MNRCLVKGLKRCPKCQSSNIYKRIRTIKIDKERHKRKMGKYKPEKVKTYVCRNCDCGHEFDTALII